MNDTSNGVVEMTSTAQQAQAFFDALETVNLDEVTTSTIRVAIRDCDDNNVPCVRHVDVENFVPMRIFNRMLASRTRIMKERAAYLTNEQNDTLPDPMLEWMIAQVLSVWQQTEPTMTRERLENGLTFEQISKLFTRFFGQQLRQMTK